MHDVVRLTPTICRSNRAHAPLSPRKNFQPGQFYRLQNFESLRTPTSSGTQPRHGRPRPQRRLGLTKERDLMSTIVLEMGGSSQSMRIILKKDEACGFDGPNRHPD